MLGSKKLTLRLRRKDGSYASNEQRTGRPAVPGVWQNVVRYGQSTSGPTKAELKINFSNEEILFLKYNRTFRGA